MDMPPNMTAKFERELEHEERLKAAAENALISDAQPKTKSKRKYSFSERLKRHFQVKQIVKLRTK